MRWRPPRNKATQKKASPVLSILFGRVGPRVARGTAAGPEGPGRQFPMAGGGRTKARCSLFCFPASEHSSGSPGGSGPGPSRRRTRGKKSGFYAPGVVFSGPRRQASTRPRRSARRRASRAPRASSAPRAARLRRSLRPRQKGSF